MILTFNTCREIAEKQAARDVVMRVQKQIDEYIASQPEAKRSDLQELNKRILEIKPESKLWFLDGKNDKGKVVSNPNIGYGSYVSFP